VKAPLEQAVSTVGPEYSQRRMHTDSVRLLVVVASGAVGLAVGSFLNVVAWRTPRGLSVVHPPSHCPRCGTVLGPLENVPVVSWIALGGRCQHCRSPISVRYPLVELATAVLFGGLAAALGAAAALPSLALLGAATVAASSVDADGLAVPRTILAAAALGSASLLVISAADHSLHRLLWAAGGGLAGGVAVVVGWRAIARAETTDRPPRSSVLVLGVSWGWAAGWEWPPALWVVAGSLAAVGLACSVLRVRSRLVAAAVPATAMLLAAAALGTR
jgi:leader peptidase (prepilin peptidase)/N-methyltransferase